MSLLVICKSLGLFLNALMADDKYCLFDRDNLLQYLQMQLSRKEKNILPIFLCIMEILIQVATFLKQKMTLIADVFLN